MEILHISLLFGVLFFILETGATQDTIVADQAIRDGDTLVSAGNMYELGFFSPGSSKNRYLGIWYKNKSPQTVVWVANRETPITDTSGVLRLDTNGSLLVFSSGNKTIVWSSKSYLLSLAILNPVAQLLNTGNLVVRESDQESFIWQSFDYPGNTLLPGMKLGKDLVSGRDRRLTSWKSLDDPFPGRFIVYLNADGFPQLCEEEDLVWLSRYGPWNGVTFNGTPRMKSMFTQEFVMNDTVVSYKYALVNSSIISRFYVSPEGNMFVLNWIDRNQEWFLYWNAFIDMCHRYGLCGPYGRCNPDNSPACSCMEGFEPQNPEEWSATEWSSGCRRRTPLDCPNGDGFRVFRNVKVPDTRHSWYNQSMTLDECAAACKANCTCTAYANTDIRRGGSGCLMWFDDLMDVRTVDESQDLYVRMAVSDLTIISGSSSIPKSSSNRKTRVIIVAVSISFGLFIILATLYTWNKKKRSLVKTPAETVNTTLQSMYEDESVQIFEEESELLSFSLPITSNSTNDFADDNKLGEGGFGAVYKGVLDDGREIAVKRLSKTSRQGLDELKNEVKFIVKLQHRNLVKLLGYCIQGEESMLIYEYMPNKSLDLFIFDKVRNKRLDWFHRFHIIHGIARGLLYLHQDSRFKIVHRDLKASNILLDAEMNPKISDFGLARMFREHENEANTNRVVGTLGYISPEYALDGIFSEKSDVFSFGVLVLEIISGKKNRGFSHEKDSDNLLAHAWRLYEEGMVLELLSEHMYDACVKSQVLRSAHIGLLCVQNHAKDRPTMSSVVLMFDQDDALPPPKQPAFFAEGSVPKVDMISVNEVTLTTLEPR